MKKAKQLSFMLATMLLAFSASFTACSDDDDDDTVDIREQAVGNYTLTTTLYVEEDGKLLPFASELAELNEALGIALEEDAFKYTGTATVSKSGSEKILVSEDDTDGDQWTLSKIKEAANGFIFDVDATTFHEVSFANYSAYHIEGETTNYGGGYISPNKKLEFYVYTTMEEMLDAVLDDEDQDNLIALLIAAGYTEADAEEDAKQKVVFEFTLTKK